MKISIRGPIVSSNQHRFYQWYGMEATSPKSVADALASGNGERAEVEINSGGGEIFAASEIYTALRNYAGGVHIRIVGLAASAASIIAMAGESEMTPTGMMMIHNVQTRARWSIPQGSCGTPTTRSRWRTWQKPGGPSRKLPP